MLRAYLRSCSGGGSADLSESRLPWRDLSGRAQGQEAVRGFTVGILAVQRLNCSEPSQSCSPVGQERSVVWSSSHPGREGAGQWPCLKSLVTRPLSCVWYNWLEQSLLALQVPPRAEEITIPADVTPEKVPTHIVDYSGRAPSLLVPCWPRFSPSLPV